MHLPYLDVVNADVFESPHHMCGKYNSLSFLVCVTLLKIRLLLDLVALLNSGCLRSKLPQELIDRMKHFIPSTEVVSKNSKIISSNNLPEIIGEVSSQVDELYVATVGVNKHFWPALLNPGKHLRARPEFHSSGSKEEMQILLQFYFDAWNETPGSIAFIKTMSNTKR